MNYTQSLTGSHPLQLRQQFKAARPEASHRKTLFAFSKEERARRGDILTWNIKLFVGGKLVDSARSYLWEDPI